MKVVYDTETDTLDLIFRNEAVAESDDVREGIIIDYDRDGKLVSVEVLHASEHVHEPKIMVYQAKASKYIPTVRPSIAEQTYQSQFVREVLRWAPSSGQSRGLVMIGFCYPQGGRYQDYTNQLITWSGCSSNIPQIFRSLPIVFPD